MRVRLVATVSAALAAAGCSAAGESREETMPGERGPTVGETRTAEPVAPARALETIIAPETLVKPRHRMESVAPADRARDGPALGHLLRPHSRPGRTA